MRSRIQFSTGQMMAIELPAHEIEAKLNEASTNGVFLLIESGSDQGAILINPDHVVFVEDDEA